MCLVEKKKIYRLHLEIDMPRIRYLKPEFFKDEDLKDLPFEARLFYQGLWCYSDREGRGEDRPERLKIEIFPYDNIDVEKMMDLLSKPKNHTKKPFINRYETDGIRYYEIINWTKHQHPHNTERPSIIPIYKPLDNVSLTVKEQDIKSKIKIKSKDKEEEKDNSDTKNVSPTDDVFIFFCQKYKKVLNTDYIPNFGKDKKIIKDLLKIKTVDEIKRLIGDFFSMKDDFVQKSGYTVGVFKSVINKLCVVFDPYRGV